MIFKEGKNYHFLTASSDSIARIQSSPSPFYPFKKSNIPELPSLSSDPVLVPKFLYSFSWNRVHYPSESFYTPAYVHFDGKEISSNRKWPPGCGFLNQMRKKVKDITTSHFPAPSKLPFFICMDNQEILQIGGWQTEGDIMLTKISRSRYGSAKYISLRDIVNPNFSEEEVIKKIQTLYFDKKSKRFLYRLVKILYAGKPAEEYKIIANLFSHELEFAKFLSKSMFSPEIIPLIHGPFLQSFLSTFDERLIRFSYPTLSSPLRKILESSVSKNKFQMILNAPLKEPQKGEGFLEKIESEVYRRFSRNIYYEEGTISTYRVKATENDERITLHIDHSTKVNFWMTHEYLNFYALTKTKLLFITKDWIEILRFDWFISKREWEPYQFHRLPPDLIIEIPYFPTGKCLVGGGITPERNAFEFTLQWFEY